MAQRWVQVTDDPDRFIHPDGPSLWNEDPFHDPEPGYHWVLESEAVGAGYDYRPSVEDRV